MTDWRVLLLSVAACCMLVVGLLMLAMPDSYEGVLLYALDAAHAVRVLDALGFALVALGGLIAWSAGLLWHRQMAG